MSFLLFWIFLLVAAGQLDCIHADNEDANTVLDYINSRRKLHGCPPLILSDELSLNCTKRAEHIASSGSVTRSKPIDDAYTENICTFDILEGALSLCVEQWYNGSRYDIMREQAEEFTAMIWRSSKFMGYGQAKLNSTHTVMVVRFEPRGNVIGHYQDNVPPLMGNNTMDSRRKKGGKGGGGKGGGGRGGGGRGGSKRVHKREHKRGYKRRKKGKGRVYHYQETDYSIRRRKWRRRNCAIHQAYQAPLIMLTIMTISNGLGFFLN